MTHRVEYNLKTGERKEIALTVKELQAREAAANAPKPYNEARQLAYQAAEQDGVLPNGVMENVDEIWKALEALQDTGVELPERAAAIVEARRAIKDQFPKT